MSRLSSSVSSIEHGGTSTGFYMDFLCYYALVFLCGTSCGGGFYMVPLAYDNGMGPRYWERESRHRATPLMFA